MIYRLLAKFDKIWLAENTKQILCTWSENRIRPEVAILVADQRERGFWGQECNLGWQKAGHKNESKLLSTNCSNNVELWASLKTSFKRETYTEETETLVPVVWKVDNSIHRINRNPADSVVCFVNTYPVNSDLSGGQCYPAFEQLGPGV